MPMIEFQCQEFIQCLSELETEGALADKWAKEHGAAMNATAEDLARLNMIADKLAKHCDRLQLVETKTRIAHFSSRISGLFDAPFQVIEAEISGVRYTLHCEIQKRKFTIIPANKSEYFERDDLFGATLHAVATPKINSEIKAAGNCLAAGLNTAAVFHLMRVAEFGLRKLAQRLNLNAARQSPIEFATWGNLLDGIDTELRRIKGIPKGVSREEELQLYSNIAAEIRAFQYAWRDPVMHARFEAPDEAENILNHVCRFMQRLAGAGILT